MAARRSWIGDVDSTPEERKAYDGGECTPGRRVVGRHGQCRFFSFVTEHRVRVAGALEAHPGRDSTHPGFRPGRSLCTTGSDFAFGVEG